MGKVHTHISDFSHITLLRITVYEMSVLASPPLQIRPLRCLETSGTSDRVTRPDVIVQRRPKQSTVKKLQWFVAFNILVMYK
jgi:hypothetical protein